MKLRVNGQVLTSIHSDRFVREEGDRFVKVFTRRRDRDGGQVLLLGDHGTLRDAGRELLARSRKLRGVAIGLVPGPVSML